MVNGADGKSGRKEAKAEILRQVGNRDGAVAHFKDKMAAPKRQIGDADEKTGKSGRVAKIDGRRFEKVADVHQHEQRRGECQPRFPVVALRKKAQKRILEHDRPEVD